MWGQAPLCARGGRARGLAARGGDGLVGAGPRGPRAGTAAVGALPVRGSSKLRAGLGGRLPTVSPSFLLQPSETTDLVSQGAQPSGEPQGRCRASRILRRARWEAGALGDPYGPGKGASSPTGPPYCRLRRWRPAEAGGRGLIFSLTAPPPFPSPFPLPPSPPLPPSLPSPPLLSPFPFHPLPLSIPLSSPVPSPSWRGPGQPSVSRRCSSKLCIPPTVPAGQGGPAARTRLEISAASRRLGVSCLRPGQDPAGAGEPAPFEVSLTKTPL